MIQDIVELRLKVLAKIPGFRGEGLVEEVLEQYFQRILRYQVGKPQFLHHKTRLLAFGLESRYFHSFYGSLVRQLSLDFDPDFEDPSRIHSFLEAFLEGVNSSNELILFEIYAPCWNFLPVLQRGWQVVASTYGGNISTSLRHLDSLSFPRLEDFSCQLDRANNPGDVDAIMELKATAFREDPKLCWFWGTSRFLQLEASRLKEAIQKQSIFLVKRQSEILGYLGLFIEEDSPYWGPCCSLDLVLDPKLKGKRLSYALYYQGFTYLQQRGIPFYKGTTANASVLSLTRKLGRWPLSYQIQPSKA